MKKNVLALLAVAGFVVACAPASKTPATPAQSSSVPGTGAPFAGIKKSDQTVAELYAGKDRLADTVVNVRGKVVKYNPQIMGKNWVHVQDGTGSSGTNDLMVTTAATTKVGDIVLVSGKITLNKDFGSGYKYALILEDANVVVETK
jgi:hypothetical protein